MSTKNRINKHHNWAINAMKYNEEARNDDWELLFTSLELNGVELTPALKFAIKDTGINYHTLLRERQRIQSSGDLLPTKEEVSKRRKILATEYTEFYGGIS